MSDHPNPPAFPHNEIDHSFPSGPCEFTHNGMTLRDWFAGQAIMGMLARGYGSAGSGVLAEKTAENAYGLAAAMLAERAKQEKPE